MRDVPDAEAALKAWRKARKALMQRMEKHGYTNPRLTAETLLQKLRSGEISSTEISRYVWRFEEEELTKFMDLLPQWMIERKHDSNV
jgi:hypothetical protein